MFLLDAFARVGVLHQHVFLIFVSLILQFNQFISFFCFIMFVGEEHNEGLRDAEAAHLINWNNTSILSFR